MRHHLEVRLVDQPLDVLRCLVVAATHVSDRSTLVFHRRLTLACSRIVAARSSSR